jgi:hypothetical protein
MKSVREDKVLTMSEVRTILRYKGQGGLYNLINDDPDFVTFTVGGKRSRRMRESALNTWIRKQEEKERAA